MSDVQASIFAILRRVLGSPQVELTRESSAKTVRGWDSLTHVAFILEVEKEFSVWFRASEISEMQNLGELVELVGKKKQQPE